jgi:folate-binding protein YgfZ
MSNLPRHARWSTPVQTIRLAGADACRFLHGQSSQAIEQAAVGDCLPTCLITPTARMRGLALVMVQEQAAELVVISGDGAAIHQALDRVLFPADQVSLGEPRPATLVRFREVPGGPPIGSAPEQGLWLQPGVDLGAGPGQPALLLGPGQAMPAWLEALPELSSLQAEQQRIRQGFPAVPAEANEHTNPFELGLAPWVSLGKVCYVGQETLAKLATYDGVKQLLRHWRCIGSVDHPALPAGLVPGTTLLTASGDRAGVITSAVADGDGIEGLALVRRLALDQPTLLSEGQELLEIRTPPAFVAPPSGPGGQRAAQP